MKELKQRSELYGDFSEIANLSQEMKSAMFVAYESNDPVVCEGLDMILHKLARIGANPNGWKNLDSWKDIAGYVKLIVDYLEKQPDMIKTFVTYEKTK